MWKYLKVYFRQALLGLSNVLSPSRHKYVIYDVHRQFFMGYEERRDKSYIYHQTGVVWWSCASREKPAYCLKFSHNINGLDKCSQFAKIGKLMGGGATHHNICLFVFLFFFCSPKCIVIYWKVFSPQRQLVLMSPNEYSYMKRSRVVSRKYPSAERRPKRV